MSEPLAWALGLWLALDTALWALLLAGVGRWGRGWGLEPGRGEGAVRACVPARDEAGRVGRCVAALLASDHPHLEVVVADDHSADATAAEAFAAGAGDPRLEIRPAGERPEGWAGKPWALTEAARGARTPWLLFVDADVVIHPAAVSAMVARAEADGADLLSLFGTWELRSFWEILVIPAVGWLVRGAVDLDRLNRDGGPAFANGQCILARREAWLDWGGHGAVAAEVLEDVRLAEVARSAGGRIRLLHAPWAFSVRLYESLGGIVAGYRKNLYEGLGRRPALALVATGAVLLTTVLPPLVALCLLAAGWWALGGWALAVTAMAVAFRWRLERADGRSGRVAPLHPLAGAVLAWILASSAWSRTTRWKGREFTRGKAS